jgi:hypothetical protein
VALKYLHDAAGRFDRADVKLYVCPRHPFTSGGP